MLTSNNTPITVLRAPPDPYPSHWASYHTPVYNYDATSRTNFIFIVNDEFITKYNLDIQLVSGRYALQQSMAQSQCIEMDQYQEKFFIVRDEILYCYNLKTGHHKHPFEINQSKNKY